MTILIRKFSTEEILKEAEIFKAPETLTILCSLGENDELVIDDKEYQVDYKRVSINTNTLEIFVTEIK